MALQASPPPKSPVPLYVGGCLLLLLMCGGAFTFFFMGMQKKVKESEGYALALKRAHEALKATNTLPPDPNDPAPTEHAAAASPAEIVRASLGDDFSDPEFLAEAKYGVSDGVTTISFTGAIKGTKGEGQIIAEATDEGGSWKLTSGKILTSDGKSLEFAHN